MRKEPQNSDGNQSSSPPRLRTQEMSLAHETQARLDHHGCVHHPCPWPFSNTGYRLWFTEAHQSPTVPCWRSISNQTDICPTRHHGARLPLASPTSHPITPPRLLPPSFWLILHQPCGLSDGFCCILLPFQIFLKQKIVPSGGQSACTLSHLSQHGSRSYQGRSEEERSCLLEYCLWPPAAPLSLVCSLSPSGLVLPAQQSVSVCRADVSPTHSMARLLLMGLQVADVSIDRPLRPVLTFYLHKHQMVVQLHLISGREGG